MWVCALRATTVASAVAAPTPGLPPQPGRITADAAAVVVGAVAIVAAVVSRPGDHALTARVVRSIRHLTWLILSIPYVAALTLSFGPTGDSLDLALRVLAALSTVLAVAITLLWAAPWIQVLARRGHALRRREWVRQLAVSLKAQTSISGDPEGQPGG